MKKSQNVHCIAIAATFVVELSCITKLSLKFKNFSFCAQLHACNVRPLKTLNTNVVGKTSVCSMPWLMSDESWVWLASEKRKTVDDALDGGGECYCQSMYRYSVGRCLPLMVSTPHTTWSSHRSHLFLLWVSEGQIPALPPFIPKFQLCHLNILDIEALTWPHE